MTRVLTVLESVCEGGGSGGVTPETALHELKGWDSMRAVNFQLELESVFSVDLSDEVITGKMTVAEVCRLLERKGVELSL